MKYIDVFPRERFFRVDEESALGLTNALFWGGQAGEVLMGGGRKVCDFCTCMGLRLAALSAVTVGDAQKVMMGGRRKVWDFPRRGGSAAACM